MVGCGRRRIEAGRFGASRSPIPGRPKRIITLFGVLAAAGALSACGGQSYTYRYRLTLEVEENGRIHTGTSVAQVTERISSKTSLQPGLVTTSVKGEATVVEVRPGTLLVALLEGISEGTPFEERGDRDWFGQGPTAVLIKALGINYTWATDVNPGLEELSKRTDAIELKPNQLPLLVTFDNPADPTTIRLVDPENMAASFGPGVHLRRATLQLTRDKLVRRIDKFFPWLNDGRNYIDGSTINKSNALSNTLQPTAFKVRM